MVQRYNAARQIAVGLAHEALAHMAARACRPDEKKSFVVAYRPPSAADAADTVTDTWLHDFDPTRQHLTDAQGRRLLVQQVYNPWSPDAQRPRASGSHAWPDGNPTHVLVAGAIPPGGMAIWQINDGPSPAARPMGAGRRNTIENEFLRVSFKRGAFELLDKKSGKVFGGIGIVEDEADRGDAWDFSPPWEPSPVISSLDFPASCRRIENGPLRSSLAAVVKMRVPRRLEGERRSRELVELPVTLRISLTRGAHRADLSVEFDNTALDHRVRLRVPTGLASDEVKSQGHFGILSRPIRHPDEGKTEWAQVPPSTFHFREWVAVDDSRRGLAVAAQGLHEYESRKNARGTDLFITLLRGIGRMGRFGLVTRPGATSPATPTPGAQCPGPQKFELSFLPYRKTDRTRTAPFLHEAESFLYPPIAHQADPDQRMINPAVHPARNAEIELAPPFAVNQANLRFSAFKRSEDGKGWILRFWENEGRKTRARLALAPGFRRVFETDLDERKRIPLKIFDQGVDLTVEPYRIVTLYMEEQK
jgi:mannosylglycerate hydrolase